MSKTYFENGVVVTPEMLNSIYHTADGHKHDGASEDGHCAQITQGEIANGAVGRDQITDGAIDESKLDIESQNYKVFHSTSAEKYFFIQELPESTQGQREHLYIEIIGGGWRSNEKRKLEYIVSNRDGLKIQREAFGEEIGAHVATIKIFDRKVYLYLSTYATAQIRASYYNESSIKNEFDFVDANGVPSGIKKYDGTIANHLNTQDVEVHGTNGSQSQSTLRAHELEVSVLGSASTLDFNSLNIGGAGRITYQLFDLSNSIDAINHRTKFTAASHIPIDYRVMVQEGAVSAGYNVPFWGKGNADVRFSNPIGDTNWHINFANAGMVGVTKPIRVIIWMQKL